MKLNFGRLQSSFTFRFVVLFALLFLATAALAVSLFARYSRLEAKRHIRTDLVASLEELLRDLEERGNMASQFSQFISSAESHAEFPGSGENMRSLEILISERAKLNGFSVDVVSVFPGEKVNDPVLKKALSGVANTALSTVAEGGKPLSLVSAAPVISEGEVARVVRVTFPIDRSYLARISRDLEVEVTFLSGGLTLATSTTCQSCLACFREVLSREETRRVLSEGKRIYFEDECTPYVHGGVATLVDSVGDSPLYLVLTREISPYLNAYRKGVLIFSASAVGFSLAVILIFGLSARRLTKPVKELTWMAREIAGGKAGLTVPVTRRDEIGVLQESLNEMSVKLKETLEELQRRKGELEDLTEELKRANEEITRWNITLEEKVREKTAELERMHGKIVETEKLAAMGRLIAGVAHEINNPLAGIAGYAQYGMEKLRETGGGIDLETAEKVREYFRIIHELALRCSGIVANFTEFSASKLEEMDYFDVGEVIEEVLALFEKQFRDAGISVVRDYDASAGKPYGSKEGMKRVIENLLLNAADAMPGGGTLTVSVRRGEGEVLLVVEDTGVGIPKENLGRIFDPFFSTREVGRGTGLGLYVAYSIVKRHGGDIEVKSEVGKGTAFTVRLPVLTHGRET
ncbi:MAG: HAMP domain-containing protein [Deltaproteobacteria bacterium]|nr:MAG: HAMP domain-containing protein [Deltaproteobacteria bacterium]